MEEIWTRAPTSEPLHGDENFVGLEATVTEFWRFALSDLRVNNTRGYLAEFIVAKAVGAGAPRVEWDAFDVLAPSGARIEVKSSAYLQVWDQRRPSRIVFSGLAGRAWDDQAGRLPTATYNADVYTFCVQTAVSHDDYNPLDLEQWQFYVLSGSQVARLGFKTVGLANLTAAAGPPIRYPNLAEAIDDAYILELEERHSSDGRTLAAFDAGRRPSIENDPSAAPVAHWHT